MKHLAIIAALAASLFSMDAMVSSAWLQAKMADKNLVIIDISERESYEKEGHIAGAVHATIEEWRSNNGTFLAVRSAAEIQKVMQKMGIDDDSTVVIYSHIQTPQDFLKTSYLYWAMKYYGLENVGLLDGGLNRWIRENRPVTNTLPTPKSGSFTAKADSSKVADRAYVAARIGKTPMIDARPPEFYFGIENSPGVKRSGHIEGAVSYFWKYSVDKEYRLKTAEELTSLFANGLGLKKEGEVIVYCTGGLETSYNYFVLSGVLGYTNVKLYDASMKEWGNRDDTPMRRHVWEMYKNSK
jgi:thiosulfate/3-mercaptopyruvate sulfurtransferase